MRAKGFGPRKLACDTVFQAHAVEHVVIVPRALQQYALQQYLRSSMETTGALVTFCLGLVPRDPTDRRADELAVGYAQQGLRAARLLRLYTDDR